MCGRRQSLGSIGAIPTRRSTSIIFKKKKYLHRQIGENATGPALNWLWISKDSKVI